MQKNNETKTIFYDLTKKTVITMQRWNQMKMQNRDLKKNQGQILVESVYILKYKKTHKFMTKNYTIQIKIKHLFVIYNNLNDFILKL